MAKYIKPKCDCGAYLYLWEEEMHEKYTPITSKGKLSKKSIIDFLSENGAYERLKCYECSNEYNIEHDDNGRIIRGEEWRR